MEVTSTVEVEISLEKVKKTLNDDKFGIFVANEWKKLINPYTPRREQNLMKNTVIEPFKITYIEMYAHYMYMGRVYVDPVYKVGGFTKDGIKWWSRPGVQKIPTDRPFNYRRDKNQFATDHWDKAAKESGQIDKLIRAIDKYLKQRG